MNENELSPDVGKQYFMSLVTMLSMSAMQQLGKLRDPATGKSEVSLNAAQATIDMLDMLEAKTAGNLDRDEEKLLRDTVSMLKLNYVETADTAKTNAPAAESGESQQDQKGASQEEKSAGQVGIKSAGLDGKHKDPKFHKSYE